ncbi:porin family protein [Deminuibacter soli]|uniref:Porin family protein n=1 Tax=Deminuibacter soli TaxID=2291815 RepID=A0A3E1NK35_9BACT|nr:porin family protein [Deminuibacter soli]
MQTATAYAQPGKFSIDALAGYTFRDRVDYANAYGYIEDAGQYSIGVEYAVQPYRAIELVFAQMDTHAPLYTYQGISLNKGQDRAALNYILAGFNNYFPVAGHVLYPYVGVGLGMAIVDAKDAGDTYTKFAYAVKGGLKVAMGNVLALKLQAQLQSVVQGAGAGIYIGTGGPGAGVTTYSSVLQFNLAGGVCITIP